MEHTHDLNAMTDEEILAYSQVHPDAFEFLVARYQQAFLERARFIVKTVDEAEDVVQDTFVRIYRFAPRFRGEAGTFRSWGMTILMNVARTRYQRQMKERSRSTQLTPEHYESLAEPSSKEAVQAKDIVERALPLLSKDAASILRLAYIEDLPYQEIAQRTGIQVGAVKTRVHRAKKELKRIIGSLAI